MTTENPYKVGDYVFANGLWAIVTELHPFGSRVESISGKPLKSGQEVALPIRGSAIPMRNDVYALEPIPLDKSWAVAFGFVKGPEDGTVYVITLQNESDLLIMFADDITIYNLYGPQTIQFVHQLQYYYHEWTGQQLKLKTIPI